AGATFAASHGGAKFIGGPIQKVSAAAMLKAAGVKRGDVDVILGGPPCQGYSVYNHKRGTDDPRAGLFREYLRIVEGVRPRWLVGALTFTPSKIGRSAFAKRRGFSHFPTRSYSRAAAPNNISKLEMRCPRCWGVAWPKRC